MDEDVKFAIRLRANEFGIYDEELIQRLFSTFQNNQYNDIEDIIEETFDTDILSTDNDYIQYTFDSQSYINNINELESYRNVRTSAPINNRLQQQARAQYNLQFPPQQFFSNQHQHHPLHLLNQMNPFIQIFDQLSNQIYSNGNISGVSSMSNMMNMMMGGMNPYEPVRVRMTKDSLNKIKDKSFDEVKNELPELDQNEKCAICWEKLSDQIEELNTYKILPCKHVFHSACISEELENYSYHCPTCKTECGDHEAILGEEEDNDDSDTFDADDEDSYYYKSMMEEVE